jgi:hypothetical protein
MLLSRTFHRRSGLGFFRPMSATPAQIAWCRLTGAAWEHLPRLATTNGMSCRAVPGSIVDDRRPLVVTATDGHDHR